MMHQITVLFALALALLWHLPSTHAITSIYVTTAPTSVFIGARWGFKVLPTADCTDLTFTPTSTDGSISFNPTSLSFTSNVAQTFTMVFPDTYTAGQTMSFTLGGTLSGGDMASFVYAGQVVSVTFEAFGYTASLHGGGARNSFNERQPLDGDSTAGDTIGFGSVQDMAYMPTLNYVLISDDGSGHIRKFDRNTGVMSPMWDGQGPRGVAVDNTNGIAYSFTASCSIIKGDPSTLSNSVWLGIPGCSGSYVAAVAGDPDTIQFTQNWGQRGFVNAAGTYLYLIDNGIIYQIDTTTRATTPLPSLSNVQVACMDSINGYIYYTISANAIFRYRLSDQQIIQVSGGGGNKDGTYGDGTSGYFGVNAIYLNAAATFMIVVESCFIRKLDLSTLTHVTLAGKLHDSISNFDSVHPICGWWDGVGSTASMDGANMAAWIESDNQLVFATQIDGWQSGVRLLDLTNNEVKPFIPTSNSCTKRYGVENGYGTEWGAMGIQTIRVYPGSATVSPKLHSYQAYYSTTTEMIEVDLHTSYKDLISQKFPVSVRSSFASSGPCAYDNSNGRIFSCGSQYIYAYVPTTQAFNTFFIGSNLIASSAYFDSTTQKFIWYESNYQSDHCAYRRISLTDFLANNVANAEDIIRDDSCNYSGAATGAFWLRDRTFAVDETHQILYSVPYLDQYRPRILKIDLSTLAYETWFDNDLRGGPDGYWSQVIQDGVSGDGGIIWAPISIAIDSTGSNLYVTDGIRDDWKLIRRIIVATKTVETISGGPGMNHVNGASCFDYNGRDAQYFTTSPADLAVDTRNDGILYVTLPFKIRSITISQSPYITSLTPSTYAGSFGSWGDVITLTGFQFGASTGDLLDISMGLSTGIEHACTSPTWISSTQVTCTTPTMLQFGRYTFTVSTAGTLRSVNSVAAYTIPALGEISAVSPINGYAMSAVVVTLTSSSFGGSISSITYSSDDGTFSSTCASISYISSTQVTCTLNSDVAGGLNLIFQVYGSNGLPTQTTASTVRYLSVIPTEMVVDALPSSVYSGSTFSIKVNPAGTPATGGFTWTPSSNAGLVFNPSSLTFTTSTPQYVALTFQSNPGASLSVTLSGATSGTQMAYFHFTSVTSSVTLKSYGYSLSQYGGGPRGASTWRHNGDGTLGTDHLSFGVISDFGATADGQTVYIADADKGGYLRKYNRATGVLSSLVVPDNVQGLTSDTANGILYYYTYDCKIKQMAVATETVTAFISSSCGSFSQSNPLDSSTITANWQNIRVNALGTKMYALSDSVLYEIDISTQAVSPIINPITSSYAVGNGIIYYASQSGSVNQIKQYVISSTTTTMIDSGDGYTGTTYTGTVLDGIHRFGGVASEFVWVSSTNELYFLAGPLLHKIALSTGAVSVAAGNITQPTALDSGYDPASGFVDGIGTNAWLQSPQKLSLNAAAGVLYFTEYVNGFQSIAREYVPTSGAVQAMLEGQNECSTNFANKDGYGPTWTAEGMKSVQFVPAATVATIRYNNKLFSYEGYGTSGHVRLLQVDLDTGYKSTLYLPFGFHTTVQNLNPLLVIASTQSYFFLNDVTVYCYSYTLGYPITFTMVERGGSAFPGEIPRIKYMNYHTNSDQLIWYEEVSGNRGCAFYRISWGNFAAGNFNNAYQIFRDDTCGTTASSNFLREGGFLIDQVNNQIYSWTVSSFSRVRILKADISSAALTNYFNFDWSTVAGLNTFGDYSSFYVPDGTEASGARLYSIQSMAIDGVAQNLYIADVAAQGATIRRFNLGTLLLETISGFHPYTDYTWYMNTCEDVSADKQTYFTPLNLAVDTRNNNQLYVQMSNRIRTLIIGTAPLITGVSPSSGTLGVASVVTLTGIQFGTSGTSLQAINVGILGTENTCNSPTWVSATQVQCTLPTNLPVGRYTFTVQVSSLTSVTSAYSALTIPYLGQVIGVVPTVVNAKQATNVVLTSSFLGSGSQVAYVRYTVNGTSLTDCTAFTPLTSTTVQCSLPATLTESSLLQFSVYNSNNVLTQDPSSLVTLAIGPQLFSSSSTGPSSSSSSSSVPSSTAGSSSGVSSSGLSSTSMSSTGVSSSSISSSSVSSSTAASSSAIPSSSAPSSTGASSTAAPLSSSATPNVTSSTADSSTGVSSSAIVSSTAYYYSSSSTGVPDVIPISQATTLIDQLLNTTSNQVVNVLPQSSVTQTVTLAGDVINVTNTNPCLISNPCQNDGTCSFTPFSNVSGIVVESTMTCSCVAGFYGPYCTLAVLGCVNCVSSYYGGNNVTLIGVGLDVVRALRIAGTVITFEKGYMATDDTEPDAKAALQLPWPQSVKSLKQVQYIRFSSPSIYIPPSANGTNATGMSSSSSTGSAALQSYDDFLPLAFDMEGAGRSLMATSDSSSDSSLSTDAGHVTSDLVIVFPNGYKFIYSISSLIYYTKDTCVKEGQWKEDGAGGCVTCPSGGYCPGGGRVWPKERYWSYNEYTAPLTCRMGEVGACPGVVASSVYASENIATGQKNTQLCAVGYKDTTCSLCADGYYMSENRCWSCGSDASAKAYFTLMLIVGFSLMAALSISVAVLNAENLANLVTAFIVIQNVVQVGKSGSTSLPSSAQFVNELFNAASIINFDIEFFKPGCSGPAITFVQLFWYTFLLWGVTGILFFLACLVRKALREKLERKEQAEKVEVERKATLERQRTAAMVRARSIERGDTDKQIEAQLAALREAQNLTDQKLHAEKITNNLHVPPMVDFRRRVLHSLLILLSIYYLKLTTLCIKGVICHYEADPAPLDGSAASSSQSLYLSVDSFTKCYQGTHIVTALFILVFFLIYVIGFPFFTFVILMRAFINPKNEGLLPWLARRFKIFRSPNGHRGISAKRVQQLTRALSNVKTPKPQIGSVWDLEVHHMESPAEKAAKEKIAIVEKELLHQAMLSRTRMDMFGYLYLGLKEQDATFRLFTSFPVSLIYALATNLTSDTNLQLFILGLTSCCSMVSVMAYTPFITGFDNLRMGVIYSGSLLHVCIMLLANDTAQSAYSPYFLILVSLWVVLTILVLMNKCHAAFGKWCDVEEEVEGEEQLQFDENGNLINISKNGDGKKPLKIETEYEKGTAIRISTVDEGEETEPEAFQVIPVGEGVGDSRSPRNIRTPSSPENVRDEAPFSVKMTSMAEGTKQFELNSAASEVTQGPITMRINGEEHIFIDRQAVDPRSPGGSLPTFTPEVLRRPMDSPVGTAGAATGTVRFHTSAPDNEISVSRSMAPPSKGLEVSVSRSKRDSKMFPSDAALYAAIVQLHPSLNVHGDGSDEVPASVSMQHRSLVSRSSDDHTLLVDALDQAIGPSSVNRSSNESAAVVAARKSIEMSQSAPSNQSQSRSRSMQSRTAASRQRASELRNSIDSSSGVVSPNSSVRLIMPSGTSSTLGTPAARPPRRTQKRVAEAASIGVAPERLTTQPAASASISSVVGTTTTTTSTPPMRPSRIRDAASSSSVSMSTSASDSNRAGSADSAK